MFRTLLIANRGAIAPDHPHRACQGLAAACRAAMGQAASTAARAIGYEGAGTLAFIREGERFVVMAINTRPEVEHPVTETITGPDRVARPLRVAAGEPLPLGQKDLATGGHAVEARLHAEDPARDDRPSVGRLSVLRFPGEGPHVRVETGVVEVLVAPRDGLVAAVRARAGDLVAEGAELGVFETASPAASA